MNVLEEKESSEGISNKDENKSISPPKIYMMENKHEGSGMMKMVTKNDYDKIYKEYKKKK